MLGTIVFLLAVAFTELGVTNKQVGNYKNAVGAHISCGNAGNVAVKLAKGLSDQVALGGT